MVLVHLLEIGKIASAGNDYALVKSVKPASDIYAPISDKIITINNALESAPE